MDNSNSLESSKFSENQEEVLLKFLWRTKNGEFAEIEESSLSYVRFPIQREIPFLQYYYSIR